MKTYKDNIIKNKIEEILRKTKIYTLGHRIDVEHSGELVEALEAFLLASLEQVEREVKGEMIKKIDYIAETLDVDKEFEDFTHFNNGFDHFRMKIQKVLSNLEKKGSL